MAHSAGSLSLFAARAAAALASFLASVYLAGVLGADEFGRYSLAIAVLTFSSLFVDFGYFASGARLLAGTDNEELKRGYVGSLLVIGAAISALFVGVVMVLALVVDRVFAVALGPTLLTVAWLAPAMVAPFVLDQILKALGRLYLLAAWQTLPRVLFLVAVIAGGALGRLSAPAAITLFLATGLVPALLVGILVRPSLQTLVPRLSEIADEHRRFGRDLYVGKLANLASYNVDRLLLGFFRDARAVGYYTLAMSIGGLVTMYGQSVAAAGFREFAHRRPISARFLRSNSLGILAASLVALVAGELVIILYLGPTYSLVAQLLVLSLVASGFQAAYQPYNSWLLANGFGVELRRFLIVVAGINIVANLTLIPAAGAVGATLASGVGMAAYLFFARRSYRRQAFSRGAS